MKLLVARGRSSSWSEDPSACNVIYDIQEITEHYWYPYSRRRANLYLEFHSLARTWRNDVAFTSSVAEMSMHPAYQRIIGMGLAVVPLLLCELETEPDHWFWALKAITGEDPVKPEDQGRLQRMADAWLKWGKEQGLQW